MQYSIYKVTNTLTGRIYIGATQQIIVKRWRQHCLDALSNNPTRLQHAIHKAILKHGADAFRVEHIACAGDRPSLMALEVQIIAQENATDSLRGYNMTAGGNVGGPLMVAGSPAAKKVGLALRGRKHPPELVARRNLAVSLAKKGKPPPRSVIEAAMQANTGKTHPPERRERAAAGLRGRARSPEHCAAISRGRTGIKLSPEHVEKIRISSTGRVQSAETREKLRQVRLNDTPETHVKRVTSMRATWYRKRSAKAVAFYASAERSPDQLGALAIARQYRA